MNVTPTPVTGLAISSSFLSGPLQLHLFAGPARTEMYTLTVLEAGSPRSRYRQGWFLPRLFFLACRQPPSHCVLKWTTTFLRCLFVSGSVLTSFYKATSHTGLRAHPHDPINDLFKSLLPIVILNLVGDTIQSITLHPLGPSNFMSFLHEK